MSVCPFPKGDRILYLSERRVTSPTPTPNCYHRASRLSLLTQPFSFSSSSSSIVGVCLYFLIRSESVAGVWPSLCVFGFVGVATCAYNKDP